MEIEIEELERLIPMLLSKDKNDQMLAGAIIENLDIINDADKLRKVLSAPSVLLDNAHEAYGIKLNGQLTCINKRYSFKSEKEALGHLSRHLTKYLGTSKIGPLAYHEKRFIKNKTEEFIEDRFGNKTTPNPHYDPNFSRTDYIKSLNAQKEEEMYVAAHDPKYTYFKTLKKLFKGGMELRKYLIENKIVEIEKL